MERQSNIMQSNADMDSTGTTATDLEYATTASARDLDDPNNEGAHYPDKMTTSGYGGTDSLPTDPEDEEEYDEEELTLVDEEDEEDLIDEEEQDGQGY